jgi:hypothetical protein
VSEESDRFMYEYGLSMGGWLFGSEAPEERIIWFVNGRLFTHMCGFGFAEAAD